MVFCLFLLSSACSVNEVFCLLLTFLLGFIVVCNYSAMSQWLNIILLWQFHSSSNLLMFFVHSDVLFIIYLCCTVDAQIHFLLQAGQIFVKVDCCCAWVGFWRSSCDFTIETERLSFPAVQSNGNPTVTYGLLIVDCGWSHRWGESIEIYYVH